MKILIDMVLWITTVLST